MATATRVRIDIPLESGDRLTREEFHRLYELRPDIKKAELVGGVVYVSSPLRAKQHGTPHARIVGWLFDYESIASDVIIADNSTVFLSAKDELQPDACLFRTDRRARARYDDEGYIEGRPDLVVEVAASSASYDLHDKKEAYLRAGVPEYIIWRTLDAAIDWFRLSNGKYVLVAPDAQDIIESNQFPGLRLNIAAMLRGDGRAVHAAMGIGKIAPDRA